MIAFIVFVFGVAIGSFLNVLIDRLPNGENIAVGRSHCDYCHKTLRWYELIPVLSWIIQGARCRRCHKKLSWQYPCIELISGCIFLGLYLYQSPIDVSSLGILRLCVWFAIGAIFLVITVTDFKYQIIPDSMLVALCVVAGILSYPIVWNVVRISLVSGVGTGLFFYLLWFGTRGKGMGFGDVKLSAVLGLMLGFPGTVIALYAAFLTGAIYGVILMLQKKAGMKSRVSFGPFLLFGACVAYFFGREIVSVWQHLV
jgi:leader peptidase (prepilin peptidase)/N-methyltransferase